MLHRNLIAVALVLIVASTFGASDYSGVFVDDEDFTAGSGSEELTALFARSAESYGSDSDVCYVPGRGEVPVGKSWSVEGVCEMGICMSGGFIGHIECAWPYEPEGCIQKITNGEFPYCCPSVLCPELKE